MLTRWGRDLDRERPLPEHPRPQLVRETAWVNLNGPWQCAFTTTPERPGDWDLEIVVPFSPETALSGVGRQLQPTEWLWYRRHVTAPTPPGGGRVLLHFGAVDQTCTVWVDGVEVGGHTGGYLPFTFDITEATREATNNQVTLEVRVRDLSETGPHARGKQRLDRGEIWYTAQSGIWQTVWLEAVPATYVESLSVEPDGTDLRVSAHLSDGGRHLTTVPTDGRRWSPEDPHLHHFTITVGEDRISSYAALRELGISDGLLTLDDEPVLHVGLLDQGYWPDGLLSAPSDDAMIHDIETAKALGFTMLRKHAKVEPLRWYHHCDRLGMLVWQDMVNGGGRYRALVTQMPARRRLPLPDRLHGLYFRTDADARQEFIDEVRRTVALLAPAPSVVAWTIFNEGWGQFNARSITRLVRRLDPTRPINPTSGWVDQGGGDIRGWHNYLRPWRLPRRAGRDRRVQALTEYGGYSLVVDDHHWGEGEFGYRHLDNAAEFADAFEALHRDEIAPSIAAPVAGRLAATVYTQLTDVEDELNGLLTWDREVLKIPPARVRSVTDLLRAAFSNRPTGAPARSARRRRR